MPVSAARGSASLRLRLARLDFSRATLLLGVSIILVIAWTTMNEWEWSFIDDPLQKMGLTESIHRSGWVKGVLDHIDGQARADWNGWGLFRPAWYVYSGLFYLATPAVAHALRLAMLLAVVLIPAVQLSSRQDKRSEAAVTAWAICLFLANTTLYQGLTFLSLQELTGLTLVAGGLATSNRLGRSALWLAAAWMKTPFVWLLLAWGVHLLLQRRTKLGTLVITLGVFTVAAAAYSARRGTYSSKFVISPTQIITSIQSAVPLFYWPALIGALGLTAFRPRLTTVVWRDPLALMLAAGGVLYFANLLPWGNIDVYYGSPVIWLLSAAAVRWIATAELRVGGEQWRFVAAALLGVAVCATGYLVTKIVNTQLTRNQAVVNLRNFAIDVRQSHPMIGVNGPEAAERLQQIVVLRQPDWTGTIVYVDAADATSDPEYYVTILDEGGVNPRLARNPVHVWAGATVYRPAVSPEPD